MKREGHALGVGVHESWHGRKWREVGKQLQGRKVGCGASEDERESRMLGSAHLDGENMPELSGKGTEKEGKIILLEFRTQKAGSLAVKMCKQCIRGETLWKYK